ncbi:LysM peptidoglycan-binding domain-containing protein [Oceanobacillus salinisoli]|uniref:LysM peptidoglycan-binding domain-containing protein n=1 Tax=Oceanobacillus salinisoli TaxID=2678611 RepID=UPI0012E14E5D|nr:LysM peptidoglycan-binding domain-containing protein [Oceanobacillus salinisoli]
MQYFYTVQPTDTLSNIASRWEIPIASLISANNLRSPDLIFVGQQLSIPPGVFRYRVRPGDSVYSISQLFRIPPSVLIQSNQLRPPYIIYIDQLLYVPPGLPYYIVQPGDTLYELAGRFNVSTDGRRNTELLQQVNQLPSDYIFPGMWLQIPYAPPGGEGMIAFNTNRGGEYDIWLYYLKDGSITPLTSGLADSFSVPEWSPNGRKIAFAGENRILYLVNVAEQSFANLDQFAENDNLSLDWSPDSTRLAYSTRNQIILYNVTDHTFSTIEQVGATDVRWFPSGTEILFQAPDENGISQIYRMFTNGTGRRRITNNTDGPLHNVRLSPNGSFVLYTTPGVSISLIHTIELSTGNIYGLEGGPLAKNYFPRWNPDSRTIAYSATAYEDREYYNQIRTVGRRGENETIHAISNCFASPVTWSPEGRRMAYLSGCTEQGYAREMWMIDLEHPVPIKLVEGEFVIASLQWAPPVKMPPVMERTYTNQQYRVTFQYPAHWQQVTEERFEGTDGFFQISAISGESLDEVCHGEAFQTLMPYGSMPEIVQTTIQRERACFIFPSEDQPLEMNQQAALIVTYPEPVEINETTYNFFILWADEPHIRKIASTLRFL